MSGNVRTGTAGAALVVVLSIATTVASGAVTDTVWRDQQQRIKAAAEPNRAKVEADRNAAGAKGEVVWYAVPAMSDRMRLMDTYPVDGRFAGEVRATLAGNESEDASFQLFSFSGFDNVDVKLSDLVCGGEKLAADLRVVKLWFQNGNAWVSYFDDSGLKLVPELLLHDENLFKVDLDRGEAWARVMKDGSETFAWITAPKPLASRDSDFNAFDPGFADADTMQPVKLVKDEFKQFFVTARAKKNQKPGVYRGKVTVANGGKVLAEIPVAFRVLDFELPFPGAYDNPDEYYVYDCMFASRGFDTFLKWTDYDEARAKALYRKWYQSLYDHGLFNAIHIEPSTEDWQIELFREIGFNFEGANGHVWTGWFGLNFGGRMNYDKWKTALRCAKEADVYYHKKLGLKDVRLAYGDEQGAAFVAAHRELWDAYAQYGFGLGFAGHAGLPIKGGYNSDYYAIACTPDNIKEISLRKEMDGRFRGFYANQHTASENPQFTRRQHGLMGYLCGMNMTYNYEFAISPFNDRGDELYRPMVIAYANSQGLMETIEYAGFREGCDDIRYATALLKLAKEAYEKGPYAAKKVARKAKQYLALLNRQEYDVNEVRAELIEYILKLRKELGK